MLPPSKPTVLFVHGSWHSPKHFQRVRDLFEAQGYPTECPCQPSFDAKPPTTSMYEDAKLIRSELTKLVEDQGKDVIVVMHSYGGVVGTEAVHESLGKKARESKGLPGGILALLYMCAFVLPPDASLGSALGGGLPPFIPVKEDGSCNMLEPDRRFYNDLSKQEQDHWVSELRPHPAIAQLTPLTYTAYLHHPVYYLFCENDEALPLDLQKMMVSNTPVDFKTESCSAGHSPFLSQPETVLNFVNKIAV